LNVNEADAFIPRPRKKKPPATVGNFSFGTGARRVAGEQVRLLCKN
jgi:hypothetical protein